MVNVKIVKKSGQSALVEWGDSNGLHRAFLPESEINPDGSVDEGIIEFAISYGLPWESIIQFNATSDAFAVEMRQRGIWTKEDVERNPAIVQGIIQSIYGVDFANFLRSMNDFIGN